MVFVRDCQFDFSRMGFILFRAKADVYYVEVLERGTIELYMHKRFADWLILKR
jgi:hypothetical protein